MLSVQVIDYRKVMFQWELCEHEARSIAAQLTLDGTDDTSIATPPEGFAPFPDGAFLLSGITLGALLVQQLVDWWTRRNRPGLLIHVDRQGQLDIRKIDVPYGTVIFIDQSGKRIETRDVSGQQLVSIMTQLLAARTKKGKE